MAAFETEPQTRACPVCGGPLRKQAEAFLCAQHGTFIRYGPILLLQAEVKAHEGPLMPWEQYPERHASDETAR